MRHFLWGSLQIAIILGVCLWVTLAWDHPQRGVAGLVAGIIAASFVTGCWMRFSVWRAKKAGVGLDVVALDPQPPRVIEQLHINRKFKQYGQPLFGAGARKLAFMLFGVIAMFALIWAQNRYF